MFSKIHAFDVSPMISRTRLLLLISAGIVLLESGNGGQVERITTRKPTIDELPLPYARLKEAMQHILLASILKEDKCTLFHPYVDGTNETFFKVNGTCCLGCKIVSDLYQERYPERPQLISSCSCRKGLKILFMDCKCQLTSGLFKWRTLSHCTRKYLKGIINFPENEDHTEDPGGGGSWGSGWWPTQWGFWDWLIADEVIEEIEETDWNDWA